MSKMWKIKYLNDAQLKGFESYKYNSVDTSLLSNYVMHPFWNYCVKFIPEWVAPNLLTFGGFLLTVVNFLLIAYYDYGFTAAIHKDNNPIPTWVWVVAAVNIFIAYTLDGIDGKQARRTGTSGPLGELFDHGLDSYSSLFIIVYLFSLFGIVDFTPMRMHYMTFCIYTNFYLTHFEKYNTGVMFLPWAYDFVMWGCTFGLLGAYILGTAFFVTPIFGMRPALLLEIILYSACVITSHPLIIYNIYKSYKDKSGKMRPIFEALRPLYNLLWLFIIMTIWAKFSPNNILNFDPRLFFILSGTIFSNISCRLIVAQMSNTRCDGWNSQLTMLLLATVVCVLPYQFIGLPAMPFMVEKWIIYCLALLVSVLHFHYGRGVVVEMCKHFDIKCFRVRYIVKPSVSNGSITNNGLNKIEYPMNDIRKVISGKFS